MTEQELPDLINAWHALVAKAQAKVRDHEARGCTCANGSDDSTAVL